jgi:hypothetical protein
VTVLVVVSESVAGWIAIRLCASVDIRQRRFYPRALTTTPQIGREIVAINTFAHGKRS